MTNGALQHLLQILVGCSHEHETWPMRLPGEGFAHRTCLDCGRRRPYTLLEAQAQLPAERSESGINYRRTSPLPPCRIAAKRPKEEQALAA